MTKKKLTNTTDSDREERLAAVLGGLVDRWNSGENPDVEMIRREYPDLAEDLIDELEVLQRIPKAAAAENPIEELGKYRILGRLSAGGMGVVYEAWDNDMDRRVAVKVIPCGLLAGDKAARRFEREAKLAAQLQHPNIVAVYSMGVDKNTPFFAMEFVEGETLDQIVRQIHAGSGGEGKLDVSGAESDRGLQHFRTIADGIAGVAEGLQYAHERGIIHRDIKPSNLIVDREGRVRILDFGLARMEGQERLTLSQDLLGTPHYMSPEQIEAQKDGVDHRTDIYSLGVSLYEVTTGLLPFAGKNHQVILRNVLRNAARNPRSIERRIPKDFETIILKCLNKKPSERFRTAEALAQDLRRFVRGDAIESRADSTVDALRRLVRRRPRAVLGVVGAVMVAVVILTLGVSHAAAVANLRSRAIEAWTEGDLRSLIAVAGSLDGTFLGLAAADDRVRSAAIDLADPVTALGQIGQLLETGKNEEAQFVAARALARQGIAGNEHLLAFLVRTAHGSPQSKEVRSQARLLLARLFQENPAITHDEINEVRAVVNAMESVLNSAESDEWDRCYAITTISCTGDCRWVRKLLARLSSTDEEGEERRLLMMSIERVARRANEGQRLDELDISWTETIGTISRELDRAIKKESLRLDILLMHLAICERARRSDHVSELPLPVNWASASGAVIKSYSACNRPGLRKLVLEDKDLLPGVLYRGGELLSELRKRAVNFDVFDAEVEELKRHLRGINEDADTFSPDSLLAADVLDARAQDVTSSGLTPYEESSIAEWYFWEGEEFLHSGSAEPGSGYLVKRDGDDDGTHLKFSAFGESHIELPFTLLEQPEQGLEISLRHIAAKRGTYPFGGTAQISVEIDGRMMRSYLLVTHHGGHRWEKLIISYERMRRGRHVLRIRLSRNSTTTYWLRGVCIAAEL